VVVDCHRIGEAVRLQRTVAHFVGVALVGLQEISKQQRIWNGESFGNANGTTDGWEKENWRRKENALKRG
jgi:hypothetical protein